ncbi:MAG: hypothetical protein JWM32_322 [Verrucomicrobia bacterium]|nr:hypothetical protein [Verrucomicrobiota bacterium]
MEIHVGCSGWFYWHWKGIFYPESEPTHRWFKHYTGVFGTVELNAPFYKWPRETTVRGWKRNAPATFRYTVKVNREITHERRMVRTKLLVRKFYEIGGVLGSQMGCFLFQFPPSYKFTASRLKSIAGQLDPAQRNVVEFRHKSWWRPSVYRAFAKHRICFCAVSAPRFPEELPPKADIIYVRFHGRSRWYRHDYTTEELTAWAQRIANSGAREAWIYFNNDREGFAIKNALDLKGLLQERL